MPLLTKSLENWMVTSPHIFFWVQILYKSTILVLNMLNIGRKMMLKLNILSEFCKFVVFWWELWFLSINHTCVCICEHLNNYAASDEFPWEFNGYESTYFILGTNHLKIHHFNFLILEHCAKNDAKTEYTLGILKICGVLMRTLIFVNKPYLHTLTP